MALKPPVPEKPYYPNRGWNPDASGLSIEPEECADILNMRITRGECSVRSGRRQLSGNVPGNNPILKTFTYKAPNNTEDLYAFTKDNIYKYVEGTDLWTYAYTFEMFDGCESVDNWVSDNYSPTLTSASTNRFNGTYAVYAPVTTDFSDAEVILGKGGVGVMDWDASDYTHIALQYLNTHTSTIDVKVRFYSDEAYTTLIESFDKTLTVTGNAYAELACEMTTPAGFSSIKSWEIIADGAEVITTAFDFHVDYICGITKLSNDVSFWSVTRFIDNTEGETMVAAGSSPPILDEGASDGGNRALVYYDVSDGYFNDLVTKRVIALGDEDTGQECPNAAEIITGTADEALVKRTGVENFDSIYKGTLILYTVEDGTLATASDVVSGVNGGTSNGYFLVPEDSTKIKSGANSWVESDGTDWSLEFLDDSLNGFKIYAAYSYKETVTYAPRFVTTFHNRLIFANTYESSVYTTWKVRWSEVADVYTFSDVNYSNLVAQDVSSIVAMEPLGDYMTIYKVDSIIKMSHIGGTAIFTFNTAWRDGIYAGRTVISFRNKHYLLGKFDVYVWDGVMLRSITKSPGETEAYRIKDTLFESLNREKLNNCFGSFFSRFKEYWLWTVAPGETYPTKVFVYSILFDIWYYFEFTATVCAGVYHTSGDPTIDELVGTIDEQNWTFEGGYTEGSIDAMVMAPSTGGLQVLDNTISSDDGYEDSAGTWIPGTVISTRFITRDFIFGDLPRMDRTERVSFEAIGEDVTVAYSSSYETNVLAFNLSYDVALGPTYEERQYFPDAVGEHIRFAFVNTGYWGFRWIQPYAILEEPVSE